jgi:hypothetical protein
VPRRKASGVVRAEKRIPRKMGNNAGDSTFPTPTITTIFAVEKEIKWGNEAKAWPARAPLPNARAARRAARHHPPHDSVMGVTRPPMAAEIRTTFTGINAFGVIVSDDGMFEYPYVGDFEVGTRVQFNIVDDDVANVEEIERRRPNV